MHSENCTRQMEMKGVWDTLSFETGQFMKNYHVASNKNNDYIMMATGRQLHIFTWNRRGVSIKGTDTQTRHSIRKSLKKY